MYLSRRKPPMVRHFCLLNSTIRMRTLVHILLAALCAQSVLGSYYHGPAAAPEVLKSGYLADTHEVAAARGAHLAALSRNPHYGHGGDNEHYGHGGDNGYYGHGGDNGYYGHGGDYSGSYVHGGSYSGSYGHGGDYSGSYRHGGDNGYYGHGVENGNYGHGDDNRYYGDGGDYSGPYGSSSSYGHDLKYHGPTASPHVLKNGHIADTHEVAVAKTAHYAAISKAKAHDGGYGYAGDYGYGQNGLASERDYTGHDRKYHGPIAIPKVLKNGHIADTREVAAAKADHYSAVAEAKTHGAQGYSHGYSGHYSH